MKNFIQSKECFISFGVALIPSIALWIFQPTDVVPYYLFVILFLVTLLFLWLFLMSYFTKRDMSNSETIIPIHIYEGILVCHPHKLLQQDVFVSLFLKVNNFEKPIGYGYVSHIQAQGIVQITVFEYCQGIEADILLHQPIQDIIIRPTVTINYINQRIEQECQNHETITSSICDQ